MKQYLADTWWHNDCTNRRLPGKIRQLPDREKCGRYLSHLVNSQDKGPTHILKDEGSRAMSRREPT